MLPGRKSRRIPPVGGTLPKAALRLPVRTSRKHIRRGRSCPGIICEGISRVEKTAQAGLVLCVVAGHCRSCSQRTLPETATAGTTPGHTRDTDGTGDGGRAGLSLGRGSCLFARELPPGAAAALLRGPFLPGGG